MIVSQRTVSVATGYDGNLTIKYETLSEFKLLLILGKKIEAVYRLERTISIMYTYSMT